MIIYVFYALLVLVSALVAYLGDLLGRHIGKRRIKIFKLRPRYSAILITSLTGSVITLLTIVIMLGTNETLRMQMLDREAFDQLQLDMKAKQAEAQAAIEAADEGIRLAQDELKTALDKNSAAQAELARIAQEQDDLKAQLAALDTRFAEGQAQATELQAKIAERQKRLDQQKREIDANSVYITEQETYIAALREDLGEYQTGEILIAEGTPLTSKALPTTLETNVLKAQLAALKDQVLVPTGALIEWPTPAEISQAAARIRTLQTDEAIVVLRIGENALVGKPVVARLEVLEQTVLFRPGQVIAFFSLESPLSRTAAVDLINESVLPTIKAKAIDAGAIPEADGSVGGFDSISIQNLITDLMEAPPESMLVVKAKVPIKRLDVLAAEVNFEWEIRPDVR